MGITVPGTTSGSSGELKEKDGHQQGSATSTAPAQWSSYCGCQLQPLWPGASLKCIAGVARKGEN